MEPEYWQLAKSQLSNNCVIMQAMILEFSAGSLKTRGLPFYTLIRSIIGQQISVKAADAVWLRLESYLKNISPAEILKAPYDELKKCGLSKQKIKYLYSAAEAFNTNEKLLHQLSTAEIYQELIKINGVGPWTAEMVLIFGFLEPDIFPIGDIGLRKAVEKNYFNGEKIDNLTLENFGLRFKPYRSVATWYLWRSLDPVPVEY